MGHRDTPEGERGARSLCRTDLGTPEAAALPKGRETRSMSQTLAVRMALFALRCYKAYLSVLFAGTCRFEPTCSQYAYQAIERFGLLRGGWLGTKRLLRCHPLSGKFGYDPVPEPSEDADRETTQRAAYHLMDGSRATKDGIGL
jgi:uncharacterized protein